MSLLAILEPGRSRKRLQGLTAAAQALCAAALFLNRKRHIVVIAADNGEAERFTAALVFHLAGRKDLLYLPQWETLPYEPLSHLPEIAAARALAFHGLASGAPAITVTTAAALLQKAPPPRVARESVLALRVGETVDRDRLGNFLALAGYAHADPVQEPGQFAFRGGILDCYPPHEAAPLRIEFFDDEVEGIRRFDSDSQRSLGQAESALLTAVKDTHYLSVKPEEVAANIEKYEKENSVKLDLLKSRVLNAQFFPAMEHYLPFFYPDAAAPLAHLPPDAMVIVCEPEKIKERLDLFGKEIIAGYADAVERKDVFPPPAMLYAPREDLELLLEAADGLNFHEIADLPENDICITVATREADRLRGAFSRFIFDCRERSARGITTLLAASGEETIARVEKLLREEEMGLSRLPAAEVPGLILRLAGGEVLPAALLAVATPLPEGFTFDEIRLAAVTEEEIFGRHAEPRRAARKKAPVFITDFADVKPGDYVVHRDHGVGQYHGLKSISAGGAAEEYLEIEYAEDQRLFLPISSIHLLEKFSGGGGAKPVLDRMGGKTWAKTREKVKKGIMRMAKELLELYALRKTGEAYAHGKEAHFEREFADSFGYLETPDQAQAIADVIADMEAPKPMDRLICGDVGYGKTEVAIRAAFKASVNGKQTALLAPTTLLVNQHYENFKRRMEPFGVKVAMLSRFVTPAEQKSALQRIAAGEIDVVIGTHRLLQKDVHFPSLGLVIIDEEQKFGVAHKEKLKKLRETVDVLTLTATPIPRTLHMAVSGIRDISVINTPPANRLSIKTLIRKFNEPTIIEAINRELSRGGQIFFLHNSVRSLENMARYLKELVPGVRAEAAHGQMGAHELSGKMDRFIRHKIDMLVCTTIVESGLDIPNANTIIINRADKFGLGQLYQLRGRVGRDRHRAYAYLLVPDTLAPLAKKRIKAMEELSELGSGFKLAARDMEIRGTGNLLGPQQSGQITAVGFETYLRMMEEAVQELRTGKPPAAVECALALEFTGKLDAAYIPPLDQRMNFYSRLYRAKNGEEIRQVAEEMADRFGSPPDKAQKLVDAVTMRMAGMNLGLEKIELTGNTLRLSFPKEPNPAPLLAANAPKFFKGKIAAGAESRLRIEIAGMAAEKIPSAVAAYLSHCAAAAAAREG